MNRKQRMDAIERRLDYLEANAAGEDDDRFSCQPEYEPDDDRVMRALEEESRLDREGSLRVLGGESAESVNADLRRRWPSADVRERVRERSNLADTLAGSSEQAWKDTALRYETSLYALREMTILRTDPMAADFYALIQGCLYGATITSEGLRTDD